MRQIRQRQAAHATAPAASATGISISANHTASAAKPSAALAIATSKATRKIREANGVAGGSMKRPSAVMVISASGGNRGMMSFIASAGCPGPT